MQNLGPKLSYDNDEISANFLPANLKLGTGFDFILDDYNKLGVNLELNKLLVPTPKVENNNGVYSGKDMNGDGVVDATDFNLSNEDYRKTGWVSGIFKSLGDAPDGFKEELKEVMYSLGAEYSYQDAFAMRLGYHHENISKSGLRYFSLGAGFKYTSVKVDVSYLFSASKIPNPLENTLRFSLTFNFGDKYEQY